MVGTVCLGSGRKRWWVRSNSAINNQSVKGSRRPMDAADEAKHLGHSRRALAKPGRSPRDDSSDRSSQQPGDSCSESVSGSGAGDGSRCSSKEPPYSGRVMSLMHVGESGPISAYSPAEQRRSSSRTSQMSDNGARRTNNSERKRSVSPSCSENKGQGIVAL